MNTRVGAAGLHEQYQSIQLTSNLRAYSFEVCPLFVYGVCVCVCVCVCVFKGRLTRLDR